ncbi:MAG: hypothetical protein V5A32_06540 [Halovenus sp.]
MSTPERDIEAVLDESGPDYDSFSYERPTAGHQGEVFFVTLEVAGESYEIVVKFEAGDQNFALEPFLHDFVADRTEVPVPRILVFNESPDLDVDPYFVTERIRGNNLAEALGALDSTTRENVIRHAGRTLGYARGDPVRGVWPARARRGAAHRRRVQLGLGAVFF